MIEYRYSRVAAGTSSDSEGRGCPYRVSFCDGAVKRRIVKGQHQVVMEVPQRAVSSASVTGPSGIRRLKAPLSGQQVHKKPIGSLAARTVAAGEAPGHQLSY